MYHNFSINCWKYVMHETQSLLPKQKNVSHHTALFGKVDSVWHLQVLQEGTEVNNPLLVHLPLRGIAHLYQRK